MEIYDLYSIAKVKHLSEVAHFLSSHKVFIFSSGSSVLLSLNLPDDNILLIFFSKCPSNLLHKHCAFVFV